MIKEKLLVLATDLDLIADGLYSTNALRAREVRNCAMRARRLAEELVQGTEAGKVAVGPKARL